jgi:hypothetical protein
MCRRGDLAPLSEGLLELAFLAAVNAAAGRKITGFGRTNLSRCALDGPVSRMELVEDERGEQSVSITLTYEWVSKADNESSKLVEQMKRGPSWREVSEPFQNHPIVLTFSKRNIKRLELADFLSQLTLREK